MFQLLLFYHYFQRYFLIFFIFLLIFTFIFKILLILLGVIFPGLKIMGLLVKSITVDSSPNLHFPPLSINLTLLLNSSITSLAEVGLSYLCYLK